MSVPMVPTVQFLNLGSSNQALHSLFPFGNSQQKIKAPTMFTANVDQVHTDNREFHMSGSALYAVLEKPVKSNIGSNAFIKFEFNVMPALPMVIKNS